MIENEGNKLTVSQYVASIFKKFVDSNFTIFDLVDFELAEGFKTATGYEISYLQSTFPETFKGLERHVSKYIQAHPKKIKTTENSVLNAAYDWSIFNKNFLSNEQKKHDFYENMLTSILFEAEGVFAERLEDKAQEMQVITQKALDTENDASIMGKTKWFTNKASLKHNLVAGEGHNVTTPIPPLSFIPMLQKAKISDLFDARRSSMYAKYKEAKFVFSDEIDASLQKDQFLVQQSNKFSKESYLKNHQMFCNTHFSKKYMCRWSQGMIWSIGGVYKDSAGTEEFVKGETLKEGELFYLKLKLPQGFDVSVFSELGGDIEISKYMYMTLSIDRYSRFSKHQNNVGKGHNLTLFPHKSQKIKTAGASGGEAIIAFDAAQIRFNGGHDTPNVTFEGFKELHDYCIAGTDDSVLISTPVFKKDWVDMYTHGKVINTPLGYISDIHVFPKGAVQGLSVILDDQASAENDKASVKDLHLSLYKEGDALLGDNYTTLRAHIEFGVNPALVMRMLYFDPVTEI